MSAKRQKKPPSAPEWTASDEEPCNPGGDHEVDFDGDLACG